jgi:hypothetical protein
VAVGPHEDDHRVGLLGGPHRPLHRADRGPEAGSEADRGDRQAGGVDAVLEDDVDHVSGGELHAGGDLVGPQ